MTLSSSSFKQFGVDGRGWFVAVGGGGVCGRLSNSVLWWWWRRWWLWWWHLEGGVGRVDQQTAEFINMLVLLLLLVSLLPLEPPVCSVCAYWSACTGCAVRCLTSRTPCPSSVPLPWLWPSPQRLSFGPRFGEVVREGWFGERVGWEEN